MFTTSFSHSHLKTPYSLPFHKQPESLENLPRMQPPFNDDFREIAEGMGISLYQRFSPAEAALFLRISLTELHKLMKCSKVNFIEVGNDKTDFFGYQLLEYLLSTVTNNKPVAPQYQKHLIASSELKKCKAWQGYQEPHYGD